MAFETQFKRDSPPGSVEDHTDGHRCGNSVHTSTTYGSDKRSEGSCEDKTELSKKPATKPSFSSKHELDAGLDAMFEMAPSEDEKKPDPLASDESPDGQDLDDEAELQLVRHLTEPLAKKHLERSKSKKKGRKKRGASLERMIAKMILQSSQPGQKAMAPPKNQKRTDDSVTTKDILSDLVKANDSTSALSGHSKETTPWMNTTQGATNALQRELQVDSASMDLLEENASDAMKEEIKLEQEHAQKHPSQESAKDAFGFAVDDGWTAFDDCPGFDTSLFPSDALDVHGFPVSPKKDTAGPEQRSGPLDLDDDSEAEEEELAEELRKEMEAEIAKESSGNASLQRKVRVERSAFVASQVPKSENNTEDEEKLRLIEEEIERKQNEERARKQREEERMREEHFRLSREMAKSRVANQEKQDQNLAKELARRIAKEQEWGKLQEMAQELARKQTEDEKYQEFGRHAKGKNSDNRPPFTLEEVEVAERDSFSDDDVSSLPTTTPSLDSRSLSQFLVKENNTPVINEIVGQDPPTSKTANDSSAAPTESDSNSSNVSSPEKPDEPSSPSSVVDLDNKQPKESKHAGMSGPLAARARYRNTRAVFASRQQSESSSPSSRPKPTWNPKPPRHYHRSANGL